VPCQRSRRSRSRRWRTRCGPPAAPSRRCGRRPRPADLLCLIAPELSAWAEGGRSRPADHPVLFEALLDAVEESTRGEQATLWVLDDVHWADDATWDFVRYAARRVGDMSLVLAVTYRDEEIGPASPRWTGLVRLQREPHVQALPVRRLASADAGRLVGALAPTVPPEVVARIVERSAGTPLLIEELARLAGSSGDLPAVPDIVRATVRGRAAHLGPAGRELLDVAALVGLAVEARTLELLRPGSSAAELVEVGLLDTDGGDYRFRHPLLWEAALAEVPAGRRRALHQELAAALAADGGYPAERVAGHLQRAGQPEAALAALEQGADAADATGDVGRCAGLYLAAFRLARTQPALDHRSPALEHEAIRHLFRARRWTELDPLIRDAWSRRDRMSEEERAWLAMPLAWHLYSQGRVAESWELIQQELAHLERAGADGDVPSLHSQAGYLAWLRGEPELARWHVERGLEAARRGADSEAVWWARHHRIHVGYRLTGDRGAAVRAFRDNAAAARAQGITDGEALAMWDLACHSARPEDIAAGLLAAERAGAGSTMQDLRVLEGALLLLEGHGRRRVAVRPLRLPDPGRRARRGPVDRPQPGPAVPAPGRAGRGPHRPARSRQRHRGGTDRIPRRRPRRGARLAGLGARPVGGRRRAPGPVHAAVAYRLLASAGRRPDLPAPARGCAAPAGPQGRRRRGPGAGPGRRPAGAVLCGRPGGGQVPPGSQP
jgi:hypothetical protein